MDLPFVGAGGSGTGAASNLTITSYPAGVALDPNNVATTWTTVVDNTFTVTAGAVTSFQFFSDGVPEPATWAMMLAGFGGLGVAMRARRRQIAATA